MVGLIEKLTKLSFGAKILRNNKDLFGKTSSKYDENDGDLIITAIDNIFMIWAIMLVLKCQKVGSSKNLVLETIIAIYFAPCYVLYRLINPC